MAVKFEDLKVGDKVTVEGVVVLKEGGFPVPADVVSVSFDGLATVHVNLSSIATHTPAPRPFKVGDEVRDDKNWPDVPLFLIGTYEEMAWVRDRSGRLTTCRLSDLRHADPVPAPQEAPVKERKKKIEYWVNVYPDGPSTRVHATKEKAIRAQSRRIVDCIPLIGYCEGDGL